MIWGDVQGEQMHIPAGFMLGARNEVAGWRHRMLALPDGVEAAISKAVYVDGTEDTDALIVGSFCVSVVHVQMNLGIH